ncbi:hypothetical protein K438DRAFT_2034253, partial [Mycena galopus ATCC 62051]
PSLRLQHCQPSSSAAQFPGPQFSCLPTYLLWLLKSDSVRHTKLLATSHVWHSSFLGLVRARSAAQPQTPANGSPQKVDFLARYRDRSRDTHTAALAEYFRITSVDPLHWWYGRRHQFPKPVPSCPQCSLHSRLCGCGGENLLWRSRYYRPPPPQSQGGNHLDADVCQGPASHG